MKRSGAKKLCLGVAAATLCLWASGAFADISVKVRDLTVVDGLKSNQIFGYGLVAGLAGTGDSRFNYTDTTLQNFIRSLGMEPEQFQSRNVAAVIVTANLDPFVRVGDKIDVTVSSIGDAKSLEGGMLIQSPLTGANGVVYAAAQGRLEFPENETMRPRSYQTTNLTGTGGTGMRRTRKPLRTVARVIGGGIVERNLSPTIVTRNEELDKEWIHLILSDWDYGVADRIIKAVAAKYPAAEPAMTFTGRIQLTLPKDIAVQEFIDGVQQIVITPADLPRVVISEHDGTVVAGGNIMLAEAFVSREGLILEITDTSERQSAVDLKEAATVKDLVDAMNAAGAGTGDIIAVMKALKRAGAIHAELIIQ